jgi:hypothetical protein
MRSTSMFTARAAGVLLLFTGCSSDAESDAAAESGAGPIFGADGADDFGVGDGTSFDGALACVGQTAGAESAPAVLQLVVDTSGSMDDDAPGVRGSKWTATRRALLDAIDEMPEQAALGVVFYPDVSSDDDGPVCFDRDLDVAIEPLGGAGAPHRRTIDRAFQNQSPDGSTPTHDAYAYAFDVLESALDSGPRSLVLITDGRPTRSLGCQDNNDNQLDAVDTAPLVRAAADARARGVSTFVVGSPGSEDARDSLSRMAEAGGTALPGCSHDGPGYCHFDMTEEQDFAAGLARALGTISGLALSCSYDVPQAPNGAALDPNRVNIVFTPPGSADELIARSADGPCSEGWQYSEDGSRILLCGATCERVRQSEGSLALQFGCATQLR